MMRLLIHIFELYVHIFDCNMTPSHGIPTSEKGRKIMKTSCGGGQLRVVKEFDILQLEE